MLRRSVCALAVSVPRSVWDPAQFNSNWPDSYSGDIAARRHWPAKKWTIGLEPRTPREWLRFSHRNLAYAYNGAMRACNTFPELLVYYTEMKQRGVKVDVDTLNVLLTRAARYEKIHMDDVFLLFDEVTSLGARPDLSSVETLHTVLDHSAGRPAEWREARRRQLVELYNHLALEEIERLAEHHVDALLSANIARIRKSLQQLSSSLSPSVYRRYFSVIDSGELLLRELHNFLWEFVAPDHPALDIASLQLRIPFVATVLKRPPATKPAAEVRPTDFEDTDVCCVIQAAVERCVDGPFHDAPPLSARRMYLSLLTMLTSTGVLYTADLVAQLMDIVKFSPLDDRRDADAIRLMRYALRGSSAAHDEAHRRLWQQVEQVVDARVVGRYLASRSPWTSLRICHDERYAFGSYPTAPLLTSVRAPTSAADSTAADAPGSAAGDSGEAAAASAVAEAESLASSRTHETPGSQRRPAPAREARTAAGLQLRWADVTALIVKTHVLRAPAPASAAGDAEATASALQQRMEVFTGMAVFLRTTATGQRYGAPNAAAASQTSGDSVAAAAAASSAAGAAIAEGMDFGVWRAIFQYVQETHSQMEHFITQAAATIAAATPPTGEQSAAVPAVEPEFECWESMLVTLRCVLDFCVLHRQQNGEAEAEALQLFKEAGAMRAKLVEESRTRFGGRMRVLWLQEA